MNDNTLAGLHLTLSTVGDTRAAFRQVSEIAKTVLPHDLLTMTSRDGKGGTLIEVSSNEGWSRGMRFEDRSRSHVPGYLFAVIEDRAREPFPLAGPSEFLNGMRTKGYRSLLSVGLNVTVRDHPLALTFWSTRGAGFTFADLRTARRIADHLAPAVARARRGDGAARVKPATDPGRTVIDGCVVRNPLTTTEF